MDLEVSTQLLSLSRRQVDIAFRNVRPEAPDLVVRRVASWPVGLFASAGYVERFGVPVPEDELRGHHLVAYAPYLEHNAFLTMAGVPARQARIALAVRSSLLVRKGVAAGIGLGEMPVWMGEREGLVRIWPERRRANDYEVWQVMHPNLQRTARVRATAEFLSEAFQVGSLPYRWSQPFACWPAGCVQRGCGTPCPILWRTSLPLQRTMSHTIHHQEQDAKGAFYITHDGQRLAEMTYSRTNATMIIVDHTEVDPSLSGQGVGRALLGALVEWARTTGTKVVPLCPFAKAQFGKDASIRDVLA